MAELIGVVAASLEFAKVLAELKAKASSIRHAPEELAVVLEELDVTDTILQALADQDSLLSIYAPPIMIQKCRGSCQKATNILRPVCLELSKAIEQSRWPGSIKFVLKDKFLEKTTRRIERAKMNLILAQSAASIAMSALSLQQQITTQSLILTEPSIRTDRSAPQDQGRSESLVMADLRADNAEMPRDDGADEQGLAITKTQKKLFGSSGRAKKTTSVLTVQSTWLGKRLKVLRMCTSGVSYFGIKTYNIIPNNSAIFGAIDRGDICAIRDLFYTKQASIYDTDSEGNTLLHIACQGPDLPTMQCLLQEGADPNERNSDRHTCFDELMCASYYTYDVDFRPSTDPPADLFSNVIRVLFGKDDADNLRGFLTETFFLMCSYVQDFGLVSPVFITIFSDPWHDIDFATRLKAAYRMLNPGKSAQGFWSVLSQSVLDIRCLTRPADETTQRCESLVLQLAWTMSSEPIDLKGWRLLLHQVVSLDGIQLTFKHRCGSPMLECLGISPVTGWCYRKSADLDHQRLTRRLRNWAHEVELAGQDLQAYGRWEEELLSGIGLEFDAPLKASAGAHFKVRVLKFTYGPSPEDWEMWVTTSMDEAAADFWEMLETYEPLLSIPGSWPEVDNPINYNWQMEEYYKDSRRRRIRWLRYLGLGRGHENEAFGEPITKEPSTKGYFRRNVEYGKKRKEKRKRFYLENDIRPPCREYIS